jgi:hypothetical protein
VNVVTVKSSQIDAIGYDLLSLKLHVIFRGGSTYEYDDVQPDAVCRVLFSESIGKAFNANIKSGGYTYRKLADSVPAHSVIR